MCPTELLSLQHVSSQWMSTYWTNHELLMATHWRSVRTYANGQTNIVLAIGLLFFWWGVIHLFAYRFFLSSFLSPLPTASLSHIIIIILNTGAIVIVMWYPCNQWLVLSPYKSIYNCVFSTGRYRHQPALWSSSFGHNAKWAAFWWHRTYIRTHQLN